MGCACFKPDVVIKSNKNIFNLSNLNQQNNNNEIRDLDNNHRQSESIFENQRVRNRNIENRNVNTQHLRIYSELREQSHNLEQPRLLMNDNPDFNMPEIEIYVGEGYMRMKAYLCEIDKKELEKKRLEFWETRVEGDSTTWEILRFLCENKDLDKETITYTINDASIKPLKECINVVYDSKGILYEIPNYCIHDPHKYVFQNPKTLKNKFNEKILKIIVKKFNEVVNLTLLNTETVEILKSKVKDLKKITNEKIRLFYGGKELKNEDKLHVYIKEDECCIQML